MHETHLHTDYLFDFRKMFQALPIYNTNEKNQIWNFCYNLFCNNADNTHTHYSLKSNFRINGTSKRINTLKYP